MTREAWDPHRIVAHRRWLAIATDLAFWSLAGVLVAAFSGPLGKWWNLSQPMLLASGTAFAALGAGLLYALSRIRPLPRLLVWSFGISNLVLAPTLFAAAEFRWLPLRTPAAWALVIAGAATLVLGVWQVRALRPA